MALKDNVFTDKDNIKDKLIDIFADYEDLDNVDMSKLGFHSYV